MFNFCGPHNNTNRFLWPWGDFEFDMPGLMGESKHNSLQMKDLFFSLFFHLLKPWKYVETDHGHNVQGRFLGHSLYKQEPVLLGSLGGSFSLRPGCIVSYICLQPQKRKKSKDPASFIGVFRTSTPPHHHHHHHHSCFYALPEIPTT